MRRRRRLTSLDSPSEPLSMTHEHLPTILILLAATVFVIAATRRAGWPALLGYVIVGLALGPYALGLIERSELTESLGELGIVFLLFTLGLEFSWPRMIAMRREVFGLGAAQVLGTTAVVAIAAVAVGVPPLVGIVIGGAVAMSSTAIILRQLTDQAEINRTHGRLAFSMLLFQDLAFVPFLALATSLARQTQAFSIEDSARAVAGGVAAVGIVLVMGRWLLRPLFREITHSQLRELFTLAVLLVVLASAWLSSEAGLSLALGGFLAGVMLAETEYRHQIEAVIRPFRDILLGLFFITVGMLLDVRILFSEFWMVSAMLLGLVATKAIVTTLASRRFVSTRFKAVRTGIVVAIGGEFGIALLTVVLGAPAAPPDFVQPLLVAIVLSMVASPLILRHNREIARLVLREEGPPGGPAPTVTDSLQGEVARRDHVILCGFGRVGQNMARVLVSQGFEYIALDLDVTRVRQAREAGEPVIYGDSSDEEVLAQVGMDTTSAVVITFANPSVSVGIVRAVRRLRPDVPILVRTQDDRRLEELQRAGATEVVPETFEASLMLVSHLMMLLNVPVSRVVRLVGNIRNDRYGLLRSVFRREFARAEDDQRADAPEELKSVVIPPGAWSVGRTLADVRERGAEVAFTGIRRHGILGREPSGSTVLREGDVVVIYGVPEALEHAEAVLLAG